MDKRGVRTAWEGKDVTAVRELAERKGLRFYDSLAGEHTHIVYIRPRYDGTPPYVATAKAGFNKRNIGDTIKVARDKFFSAIEALSDVGDSKHE